MRFIDVLTSRTGTVWSVAWSPDGRRLATAGEDRNARIWDPVTGQILHTLSGHDQNVEWVVWSPGGRQVATAGVVVVRRHRVA
ncbi:WD40 repeat domain-containing protein [Catellatospora tritici]|uniref:WD40 repeat domain-containing protein n=1 Tax=Catellatospora tritici TaxID=2851566 RepID=UPI001C2D049C|nr:hypothetical protein [Catellatospora tritici]MBV1856622.1 hypothetical protein [Catellatospora tritici]